NETVQPPPPSPAVNRGSLSNTVDGQYQLGARRGEPGALTGTNSTSTRFFNPNFDPGFGASRVTVPYNAALNPSGPFSVEFWAKPTTLVTDVFCTVASINSDPAVASPTNASPRMGWLFYQNGSTNSTSNQWQFRVGNAGGYIDNDAIKGGIVNTGAWHHVVGTFDGSPAALYVNGLQGGSPAVSGYKPNTARSLRIGTTTFDGIIGPTGSFAGNRGFDGWIEEVAFYGTALKATDIAAHYNIAKTNGGAYPATVLANRPLGYWRLTEPANPPAV